MKFKNKEERGEGGDKTRKDSREDGIKSKEQKNQTLTTETTGIEL